MARKYLGPTIDIHAGGIDLKFPHHENEIAQSEGANSVPFCNCWVHNGFVNIGDEKMSKSKGNFLTLRKACPTAEDVRAYRYLVVSSQYRNPLSFTETALGAAKGALKRLDRILVMIEDALKENDEGKNDKDSSSSSSSSSEIAATVEKELSSFEAAIADDLSMPRASACLFSIVKAAEKEFKRVAKRNEGGGGDEGEPPLDLVGLARVHEALVQMDQVFGIYYEVPQVKGDDGAKNESSSGDDSAVPENVMDLVIQRNEAKHAKDWELADSLRTMIAELGFVVKDVKGGDPIVSKL
jgi:cysteinyl-tRNA synthetase